VDYADYGKYLSQQRELRGLSREDVARATKIPFALIGALESGHVDRLPARVFVLHYIKAYAQVIGLSADEAVLRYEEIDKTAAAMPPPAALELQRRRRAWVTLSLLLLGVALVIYGSLVAQGKVARPF
jgi:cytoskeletal protein RodZ